MPLVRSLTAVTLLFLVVCPRLSAQTTYATITGTVTDSSGGVIKGAVVVATNVETSVATKTTTNDDGVYTVAQLREGPYLLSITAAGSSGVLATDIVLVYPRRPSHRCRTRSSAVSKRRFGSRGAVRRSSSRRRASATCGPPSSCERCRSTIPASGRTLAITPMLTLRGGTYTFAGSKYNQSQFSLDGTTMSDGVGEIGHRTARQLHRVVQGSEDRYREQQRRIGESRAGHDYLEVGNEPLRRGGVRLLPEPDLPRGESVFRSGVARASFISPVWRSADRR